MPARVSFFEGYSDTCGDRVAVIHTIIIYVYMVAVLHQPFLNVLWINGVHSVPMQDVISAS